MLHWNHSCEIHPRIFVLFLLFARMKSVSFLATPPPTNLRLLLYPTGHPQEGMSQFPLKVSSCQRGLFPATFACGKRHYINTIYLNFPLCLLQVAGEQKYHPECFTCLNCRTFIGDGDTYALVERSKLYWWGVRSDCQRLNLLLFTFNTCLTKAADGMKTATVEKHESVQLNLGLRDLLSQSEITVSKVVLYLGVWWFWKWVAW